MSSEPTNHCDVVIVGAGLAGSAAAIQLRRQGLRVTLVDPNPVFPRLFRAEKIEPDQSELLAKLGLLDVVRERTRLITEIVRAKGGVVRFRRPVEQLGISYQDIVNQVRAQFPQDMDLRIGRVVKIDADVDQPSVTLVDGTVITGRLVVLSTGMTGDLYQQLGVQREMVMDELSSVFGFMLVRRDGAPFPFEAVTYRPTGTAQRLGYLTLFGMGESMRGNLFTYWRTKDADTREMVKSPDATLRKVLPGLDAVIGDFTISGRVEPYRIDLYRMKDCARPGVLLLGDAYQSVCPSTGMGLSKVLTDVDVFCTELAPAWFKTPGMPVAKIDEFYRSARKRDVDDRALSAALSGRRQIVDRSPIWQVRRWIRDWRWATGR